MASDPGVRPLAHSVHPAVRMYATSPRGARWGRSHMSRYQLIRILGRGGMGVVWLAHDTVLNRPVAIKRPMCTTPDLDVRARREALALRVLRVPGVVALVDEGDDADGRFLVTDFVDGMPFPGATPVDLMEVTGRLLEVLAGVHASGIVHRDLKPGNVLVDADDRPWLVDFGIASGSALGAAVTADGAIVGTPRYIAPEQLTGNRVDARADLYALGLMLYEVLCGDLPFGGDGAVRLWRDVPPVADIRPTAPAMLARLVDRLCARLPERRPASAAEALALLGRAPPSPRIRWLGPRSTVSGLVEAARSGRKVDPSGPAGCGRTRHLQEAASQLAAIGHDVRWLVGGRRPLSALRTTLGIEGRADPESCRTTLRARFAGGLVIVVDPPDIADRWSATMLSEVPGPVLGLGESITIAPLSETDLRDAFLGPDKVLHLRVDAARELYRRSRGLPARVTTVLSEWIDAGLCRMELDRIRITRADVERLEDLPLRAPGLAGTLPVEPGVVRALPWVVLADGALDVSGLAEVLRLAPWEATLLVEELVDRRLVDTFDGQLVPRAGAEAALALWNDDERRSSHRTLAAVLQPGTRVHWKHVVHGGDPDEIANEGASFAAALSAAGRFRIAVHVLETALAAARGRVPIPIELGLLRAIVLAAHGSEDASARDAAAVLVDRSDARRLGAPWLEPFADASLALSRRDFGEAERWAGEVPELDDEAMEVARVTMLVEARTRRRPLDASAEIERWTAWARHSDDRLGRWLGWLGLAAYRAERFSEAAELHADAGRHRADPFGRLVALVNEVMALIEVPRMDAAAEGALRAIALAADLRQPGLELRAWTVLRGVQYRTDSSHEVDGELVAAADQADAPGAAAPHLLLEGTVAWRERDVVTATALLRRARARFRGFTTGELVCDVLLHSLDPSPTDWVQRLTPLRGTRVGFQLGAVIGADAIDAVCADRDIGRLSNGHPDLRLEILSPAEIRERFTL